MKNAKIIAAVKAADYNYPKMSIEELNIKLCDKTFNNDEIVKVNLLLEAINDWPDDIDSLGGFLEAIKVDLKSSDCGYSTLNKKISKLNPSVDAWKIESYTLLIELMQISNYKTLSEIVSYFENYDMHS